MEDIAVEKSWYIVTTYSGHEQKVAQNLKNCIENFNLQNLIFRVVVAEEQIPVLDKNGKQAMKKNKETGMEEPKVKIRNLYPGYVFVEMIMTDDTWYVVRNTQGVTGIAGSSGGGQKPMPVSSAEMETVLKRMGMADNDMYDHYHIGDFVKIIRGTFDGTEGKIISMDKEKGSVTVEAIFFGRSTPIEAEFSEIVHI